MVPAPGRRRAAPVNARPLKRIAVMQPYFFPYAGYFRLFGQVDEFVMLDCVQFPRTGRVHRSEIDHDRVGPRWLTLPLARQARNTLIRDLQFAEGARAELDRRLAVLPGLARPGNPAAERLREHLHSPLGGVVDFLGQGLRLCCDLFGLDTPIVHSSQLDTPGHLRGQQRILSICQARGATHYLNAPGGRDLYAPEAFEQAGIRLEFLPPYLGPHAHLLPSLLRDGAGPIAEELARLKQGEGP